MKIPLLVFCLFAQTAIANDTLTKRLQAADRSEEDRQTDARRLPAQVLTFFGIKEGDNVLDLFSGSGYYAEILSIAVGPTGKVDAHNNQAYIDYVGKDKIFARYKGDRLPNVKQMIAEPNAMALCEQCYDSALMILAFHDLYFVDNNSGWPAIDADNFMQAVFDSLKPGGTVGIVDHEAKAGSDISVAQSLHRIDPQQIISRMQQWGFVFDGESDIHKNEADDKNLPMWHESIRGKTSRTVMRFKKPS